jgi:hypothetical protein
MPAFALLIALFLSACTFESAGLFDLIGNDREFPEVLTEQDLDAFDRAAAQWCERTCGACCPSGYSVELEWEDADAGHAHVHWDPDRRTAHMTSAVVSEADWYSWALLLLGLSCQVPQSDRPGDAMYPGRRATRLSDHDVELAGGLCR